MSASADASWFGAWLRERVLASWYLLVPLALFITLVGGTELFFARVGIALAGIVAFRLWDDVEDVTHDRQHHPTRVLCRLRFTQQPYFVALLGLVLTTMWIGFMGGHVSLLLGVGIASVGIFDARASFPRLRPLFAHVLLLKVPALAIGLALRDTPHLVTLGRALTLYGVVCAYELLHDEDARRSPLAPALAVLDLVCLCAGPAISLLPPRVFP